MKTRDRNKDQNIERTTRMGQKGNIKRKIATNTEKNRETMKIVTIMRAKPKD